MKKFLSIIFIFISIITVEAQISVSKGKFSKLFDNVNHELCIQLYEKGNGVAGSYMVYMVLEDLTMSEQLQLATWDLLSLDTKSAIVGDWAKQGKRIETEAMPMIMYPPTIPGNLKPAVARKPVSKPYDPIAAEEAYEKMKKDSANKSLIHKK